MSLGGGSRINTFTVTVSVVLIVFSIISSGIVSAYTDTQFNNEFGGVGFDWSYAEEFNESDYGNITRPAWLDIEELLLTDLTPDCVVEWHSDLFANSFFRTFRYGKDWWDGWVKYGLEPTRRTEELIIQEAEPDYETGIDFSHFIDDAGQSFETHVFYYPLFYVNGTGDMVFIYDSLQESFDNDEISVVVGTNATYPSYDVFAIFKIVTTFETYAGIPSEVDVLIKTVFWGLLLLLIVKLFVG